MYVLKLSQLIKKYKRFETTQDMQPSAVNGFGGHAGNKRLIWSYAGSELMGGKL